MTAFSTDPLFNLAAPLDAVLGLYGPTAKQLAAARQQAGEALAAVLNDATATRADRTLARDRFTDACQAANGPRLAPDATGLEHDAALAYHQACFEYDRAGLLDTDVACAARERAYAAWMGIRLRERPYVVVAEAYMVPPCAA